MSATLDEKSRRRFAGLLALAAKHGDVQRLIEITGLSRKFDDPNAADGVAIPYGIYDVGRDRGFVVVGVSHQTPEFVIATIRCWWLHEGRRAYPGITPEQKAQISLTPHRVLPKWNYMIEPHATSDRK